MTSNKTTLTREALLERAKPRYEVVDVPGWGTVGIRTQLETKRARRAADHFVNGKYQQDVADKRRAYMMIDQLMIDEETPMFQESDVEALASGNGAVYDELIYAIQQFNEEYDPENDPKKKLDESNDSNAG